MKNLIRLTGIAVLVLLYSCSKKVLPSNSAVNKNFNLTDFSMGADLSYVAQMQDKGVVYKDSEKVKDVFAVFKDHGCNTVRLKLWHTPKAFSSNWGNDQEYNDLAHVTALIKRARENGMYVSLDLHYSDTWADPQKQYLPEAWKDLQLDILKDSVYQYTLFVLNYLKSKNLVPEMIQVGNETNNGMLWPIGQVVNNDFRSFAELLNSGIKAVRNFSRSSVIKPKIILHEAQLQTAEWWMNGITKDGVKDFDIIGLSHYQDWSTVNNMADITATVKRLKDTYGKQVMIVETAYWWNTKDANAYKISQTPVTGYPFTEEGQYLYLKDLTQAVIDGGGSGIQYWAPDYISNKGGEMTARSLVDFNGNVLPGIDFMKFNYKF